MTTFIEERLKKLEVNEKNHAKEILRLKKEIVELQTTIFELTEEKSHTTAKFQEMETQFRQIEDTLSDVFGFKDDIVTRLTHLESKVTHLRDDHDRVCKLETTMNESRQETYTHCQRVKDKLDSFERKLNKYSSRAHEAFDEEETYVKSVITAQQGIETMEIEKQQGACWDAEEMQVKTVAGPIGAVQDKSVTQAMSATGQLELLEKQYRDIQESFTALKSENIKALTLRRINQVHLKPSQNLITGQFVKLDRLGFLSGFSETFDIESCCLQAQIDGDYFVNMSFVQENGGQLTMWAQSDDWPDEFYFGQTVRDNDVFSAIHVFTLRKGQKLWFEVCRLDGTAEIAGCYLYSWLY